MAVQGATAHRTELQPARRPLTPRARYGQHAVALLPDSALAITVCELADQARDDAVLGRAVRAALAAWRDQLRQVTK